jgi:hypothetical protein
MSVGAKTDDGIFGIVQIVCGYHEGDQTIRSVDRHRLIYLCNRLKPIVSGSGTFLSQTGEMHIGFHALTGPFWRSEALPEDIGTSVHDADAVVHRARRVFLSAFQPALRQWSPTSLLPAIGTRARTPTVRIQFVTGSFHGT